MKKFLVTQELDYVQGHLKYGHRELYVYADSLEEAKRNLWMNTWKEIWKLLLMTTVFMIGKVEAIHMQLQR